MKKINIGTYANQGHGYAGWVEPEDLSWIVFLRVDGGAEFFRRDATGAAQ